MNVMISLCGATDESDLRSLQRWLLEDDDLRGVEIGRVSRDVEPEQMGAVSDILVVALGAGGAGAVLAQAVALWLQTRVSKVTVRISSPDGTTLAVDATNVRDPDSFTKTVADLLGEHNDGHS